MAPRHQLAIGGFEYDDTSFEGFKVGGASGSKGSLDISSGLMEGCRRAGLVLKVPFDVATVSTTCARGGVISYESEGQHLTFARDVILLNDKRMISESLVNTAYIGDIAITHQQVDEPWTTWLL